VNVGFCILGWHYFERFYEQIYAIPGDKYVISHRPGAYLSGRTVGRLIANDLRVCRNEGLDWGGYHQFNELVNIERYDAIIYCHDDLDIKDSGVVAAVGARLREPGVMVVGNGNNGADTEFLAGKYRRSLFWNDVPDDMVVRTVRGSFFAVRPEVFRRIGNFPVYWPASERNLKKGNISLRNFGYIVTKTFGARSITYLEPESWLETRYIIEMRRGQTVPKRVAVTSE
jgi:hypothetical protein